jgi:hypothetical protein
MEERGIVDFHDMRPPLLRLSWWIAACVITCALSVARLPGQEPAAPSAVKAAQVLGSITAADPAAHTITVKDDKDGADHVVSVANTRTLLKVPPGSKDLTNAMRITADDLAAGDRVSVRGALSDDGSNIIAARSVVLMSARDLQDARQLETAAWQNSTTGTVTTLDAAARSIGIMVRTPEGPKAISVKAPEKVKFTRYNPASPKSPSASQITDIQPGDQVRVIGQKSDDGSSITAEKVFSGAFRTVPGVITSIAPDGKEIDMKDLQSKRQVRVALTPESTVHKMPLPMAMLLAQRLNPKSAGGSAGAESAAGANQPTPSQALANQAPPGQPAPGQFPRAGMRGAGNGDLSRLLERIPQIGISELKPGDAVVVSGAMAKDKSQLFASSVIAGVEPIFQSAPPRQGQSLSGDWSLDMAVPAQ